jgi:hypothetical protein
VPAVVIDDKGTIHAFNKPSQVLLHHLFVSHRDYSRSFNTELSRTTRRSCSATR